MINIPAPVVRFTQKAVNWCVKNGPRIMAIGGGAMAVGGAVMACEATLHADEVLDRHKQKMARIEAAVALQKDSGGDSTMEYTEKDMKRDKTQVYIETAIDFAKLYGLAVAVGLGGVGLMEGAFGIMDRRHSTAVAALTALDTSFNEYKSRVRNELGEDVAKKLDDGFSKAREQKKIPLTKEDGEVEEVDAIVLDPDAVQDPFFFIFDEKNPNWFGNNGYLLNERFIASTIDAYNYKLQGKTVDHIWVNDVLEHLGIERTDLGHFHGWTVGGGDVIEYRIIPYVYCFDNENNSQFPRLVETSMDVLRELEMSDVQLGYCIGLQLLSSTDGEKDLIEPRMIYNEVYGK